MEANSVDPDQMPHSAASELDLHCLHNTPKEVSVPKRVNNALGIAFKNWRLLLSKRVSSPGSNFFPLTGAIKKEGDQYTLLCMNYLSWKEFPFHLTRVSILSENYHSH